jgi:Na+-driven multidrug efflux pump
MPMMISFVGFSTFRGTMEIKTSVKITLVSSMATAVLDPLLIHVFGVGVRGAAIAGLCGECTAAFIYLKLLTQKNLLRWEKLLRLPAWSAVAPLIKGSIALQIRSFAMNLTQLMVARAIQGIDDTGVAPAAHVLALQTFQLGGIVLGALGMATQTLVPNAMAKTDESSQVNGVPYAQALLRRLLGLGMSLGFAIGSVQLLLLPAILRSSPLMEVREAARVPSLIAIAFQAINGVINVGEGAMMGSGSFIWLSINNVVAALSYLGTLRVFPQAFGLTGVWICLSTFTLIRLAGVLAHLFVTLPSQKSKMEKIDPRP